MYEKVLSQALDCSLPIKIMDELWKLSYFLLTAGNVL